MRCRITFSLGASFAGLILEHGIVDSLEKLHLVLVRVHSVVIPSDATESGNCAVLQWRVKCLGILPLTTMNDEVSRRHSRRRRSKFVLAKSTV